MKEMRGYTCAHCGLSFYSPRPEGEAEEEFTALFGRPPEKEEPVICNDCWNEFLPQIEEAAKYERQIQETEKEEEEERNTEAESDARSSSDSERNG